MEKSPLHSQSKCNRFSFLMTYDVQAGKLYAGLRSKDGELTDMQVGRTPMGYLHWVEQKIMKGYRQKWCTLPEDVEAPLPTGRELRRQDIFRPVMDDVNPLFDRDLGESSEDD